MSALRVTKAKGHIPAPVVLGLELVARPGRRQRGVDGSVKRAALPAAATARLPQRQARVGDVLERLGGQHEVERPVVPAERLDVLLRILDVHEPSASARYGCIRPMLLISAIRSARKASSRTSSASVAAAVP